MRTNDDSLEKLVIQGKVEAKRPMEYLNRARSTKCQNLRMKTNGPT